ncbi:MAG: ASKHA domain-containing protein [Kiritimatiellia bacterium]|jgi:uncharacterized 2Fe-2S/4Fe-4S cluster protein (DUF4445 family)
MTVTVGKSGALPQRLAEAGVQLDLRCGGNGTCGRCRVVLKSGDWEVDGAPVATPTHARACRTRLVRGVGVVDVPRSSLLEAGGGGQISDGWRIGRALPDNREPVVAIDLGTTSIAAAKLVHGKVVARASAYNPQMKYGDNVVTRISHAAAGGLEPMRQTVVEGLRALLRELGMDGVARIAVAGNTVMSCILHGVNPESIGVMPFTPPTRRFPVAHDLVEGVPVHTMPSISGYIGGDLCAGLHETALAAGEMLVDIGTNCEIILATQAGYVCAAAAAGPAFEGAGLSSGSRAVPGAMDHYHGEGGFTVIGGGASPDGLCGSAIVDFVAVERRSGRLNRVGRFDPPVAEFAVAPGIAINEKDLEQVLKAKAAVWAGIKTLEDHCGVAASRIYLAGGFAQHLDVPNAVAIGMLPARDYVIAGNTCLAGAARLACDPATLREFDALSDLPEEVPLNTLPSFEDNYIDGLLLP